MDITPHVNLLKSLRGERVNYPILIGEGIDNALDAGATSIAIHLDDDEISFQDNGCGIDREHIVALFSLGNHGAMTTTQLGRFGIGIKHQAVNAGNIFSIESISHDGRVILAVNWRDVLRDGRWQIRDPRWLPVAVGTPTGTIITIGDLRKSPATPLEKIRDEIALQFRPAIAEGKQISLNGVPIDLIADPKLSDVVDRQFALSDGRLAHLHAGILVHPSKLNRVHLAFKHRVIMPGSPLGCGEFGGLNKMFARVQISGPWHLARFKDNITDEGEREELEDAVGEALRPILERCSSESMSARITHLSKAINELVPPEYQPARPRSKERQQDSDGRKSKNGKIGGGIIAAEKSEPDGPARAKRSPHDSLIITFDGTADDDGIGRCRSGGRTQRVDLSKDDPLIAQLVALRDDRLAAQVIVALAIAIFEHHRSPGQADLYESFGKRIANMLALNPRAKEAAQR